MEKKSEIATYVVEKIGKGFLLKTMVHICQRLLNGHKCWPLVVVSYATCDAFFGSLLIFPNPFGTLDFQDFEI